MARLFQSTGFVVICYALMIVAIFILWATS